MRVGGSDLINGLPIDTESAVCAHHNFQGKQHRQKSPKTIEKRRPWRAQSAGRRVRRWPGCAREQVSSLPVPYMVSVTSRVTVSEAGSGIQRPPTFRPSKIALSASMTRRRCSKLDEVGRRESTYRCTTVWWRY